MSCSKDSEPLEDSYLEDDFFFSNKREMKKLRKIQSSKDRSKYKKTNQKKQDALLKQELDSLKQSKHLKEGFVVAVTSQGFCVFYGNKQFTCSLRGALKKEKRKQKNLIIVGDNVLFEAIDDQEGMIYWVKERKSILSRADNLNRKQEQLIAANVDQVIITASVVSPTLKPHLIDRYIIASRKGNMQAVVVINKIDLLEDKSQSIEVQEEKELFEKIKTLYQSIGISIFTLSIHHPQSLEALSHILKGKTSVFSGQSGVGKSSLINAVTGLELKTGENVKKTKKGSHTTSSAQLLSLPQGGWCIDTPGIKSFGLWNIKKEELEKYYDEIYKVSHYCKFPNCSHQQEPDCAVIQAVDEGVIFQLRFQSYQHLMLSLKQKHLNR